MESESIYVLLYYHANHEQIISLFRQEYLLVLQEMKIIAPQRYQLVFFDQSTSYWEMVIEPSEVSKHITAIKSCYQTKADGSFLSQLDLVTGLIYFHFQPTTDPDRTEMILACLMEVVRQIPAYVICPDHRVLTELGEPVYLPKINSGDLLQPSEEQLLSSFNGKMKTKEQIFVKLLSFYTLATLATMNLSQARETEITSFYQTLTTRYHFNMDSEDQGDLVMLKQKKYTRSDLQRLVKYYQRCALFLGVLSIMEFPSLAEWCDVQKINDILFSSTPLNHRLPQLSCQSEEVIFSYLAKIQSYRKIENGQDTINRDVLEEHYQALCWLVSEDHLS